jgi:hypothetical protein
MDENRAWEAFLHTGSVQDYLAYARCREEEKQEDTREEGLYENRCPGPGGFGEARG